MVQFWFNAGLRPGEMIAARWTKADLDSKTLRDDLDQVAGVEKAPKTAAGIRERGPDSGSQPLVSGSAARSRGRDDGLHGLREVQPRRLSEAQSAAERNLTRPSCVRITCESNANQRQSGTVWRRSTPRLFIGVDRIGWWSWGDSNPRPQAFIAQFYMFSDLI